MEIPPPGEFVRLVMEKLGVTTPTEFAKALGLTDFNSPQRVGRWMNGRNGPSYEGTMLMLRAAGWLSLDRPAADLLDEAGQAARAAEAAAEDLVEPESPAQRAWRPL